MADLTRRRVSPWVVVFVLALVNLPLVHSAWLDHRVASSGVDVTAQLTRYNQDDGKYAVEFAYRSDIDPDATEGRYSATVDRAAYDRAVASGEVAVRVLRDRPAAYEVQGQVTSRVAFLVTGVTDALLLLVAVLFWAARRPGRGEGPRDDSVRHSGA